MEDTPKELCSPQPYALLASMVRAAALAASEPIRCRYLSL